MLKTLSRNRALVILSAVIVVPVLLYGMFLMYRPLIAGANPLEYCYEQPQGASTTPSFMSPGAGTSTYNFSKCSAGGTAIETAVLDIQINASTSPTANFNIVDLRVEHSRDGIDYYPDTNALATSASTTPVSGDAAVYRMNLSTSTPYGNAGSGTNGRLHRSLKFNIPPTPYFRVIASIPHIPGGLSTSSNAAIWMELNATRERSEGGGR